MKSSDAHLPHFYVDSEVKVFLDLHKNICVNITLLCHSPPRRRVIYCYCPTVRGDG